MHKLKALSSLFIFALLLPISGCTSKNESTPDSSDKNVAALGILIEHVSSTKITIGAAEISFLEFKVCNKESSDNCAYAGVVQDKNNNVIDLQWKENSWVDHSAITLADLTAALPQSAVSTQEINVDHLSIQKNLLTLNAQNLSLCRRVQYWQKLVNIAVSKRTAFYLHFATKNFSAKNTLVRADSASGVVSTLNSVNISQDSDPNINFILNLNDSTKEIVQDNALIDFKDHQNVCANFYESKKWSKSFFIPHNDEDASRYIDTQIPIINASNLNAADLKNLKIDPSAPDYFKPNAFDVYWSMINPTQEILKSPKKRTHIEASKNQMKVRQEAVASLNSDFSAAANQIMARIGAQYSTTLSAQVYSNYLKRIAGQVDRIQDGLDNIDSLGPQIIEQAFDDYKGVIRERFASSFGNRKAIFYDQNNIIDATAETITTFEKICTNGRPEVKPNVSKEVSSFSMEYNIGNEGGISRVKINESYSGDTKKQQQAAPKRLQTAASLAQNIVLPDAAGPTATRATMSAPWLLGSALVYSYVAHYNAAEEQARIIKQIPDTATNEGVLHHYSQSCKDLQLLTGLLRKHLKQLKSSPAEREQLISEVQTQKKDIALYWQDSFNNSKALEFIRLADLAQSNKCVEKSHTNITEELCYKDFENYVLVGLPEVTLPLDLNLISKTIAPLEEMAEEYTLKYPKEKRAELLAAQLILGLGPHWEKTQASLHELGLDSLEVSMRSLYQRLRTILQELSAHKKASWSQAKPTIFDDKKNQSEFDQLQKQHKDLLVSGANVVLDRMARPTFQKNVEEYISKARTFDERWGYEEQVRDYDKSIDSLERIYKQL